MELVIVGRGAYGTALGHVYKKKYKKTHFVVRDGAWPKTAGPTVVILAVSAQNLMDVTLAHGKRLAQADFVVTTAKGLIHFQNTTPSDFLRKQVRGIRLATLSGPSFAEELKKGHPCAVVLASKDKALLTRFAHYFSTSRIRVYLSSDPRGVELCGALKNIYAVVAGISAGLGFGENARAALVSRALAEMARLVPQLNGKQLTCFGLAGAGDLFLTCSSRKSRNFQFGEGLALGLSQSRLIQGLGTVEGAWAAEVALSLARKKRTRVPLIEAVVSILKEDVTPMKAFTALMDRRIHGEFDD